MMSKFFLLLSLLAVVGCACHTPPKTGQFDGPWNVEYTAHAQDRVNTLVIPVWIDAEFSTTMRMHIAKAITQWNTALNGYLFLLPMGESDEKSTDYLLAGQPGMQIMAVSKDVAPPQVLGWTEDISSPFVHIVTDQFVAGNETAVVLHEMGHSLGLDHSPKQGSLMYYAYNNQAPCVDEDVARTLAYLHGWDGNHMNWCTP